MKILAVKLRNSFQIYTLEKSDIFIEKDSLAVVDTEHGVDLGRIIKMSMPPADKNQPSAKIIRKATDEDLADIPLIEELEKNAFDVCREKAAARNLNMKLISVKVLFDRTKIIFYFVADNRVDFRELVRELAGIFRTRIEMRQIGVRDEARLVSGYGPCGRIQCCVNQREEFDPVSIKMAKEQNLNLNSLKISGMCGRLLCCLGYEYETYRELAADMPEVRTEIICDNDRFSVFSVDILKQTLKIKDKDDDSFLDISRSDIEKRGNSFYIKKEVIDRIRCQDDSSEEDFD